MKFENYEFSPILRKDVELREFVDRTQQIINLGRYQLRVIEGIPGWTGDEGEMVAYSSGGVYRLYIYINSSWRVVALT